MVTKSGVTKVNYTKDGVEQSKDVAYSVSLAASEVTKDGETSYAATSLSDALEIAKGKLSDEEKKNPDENASKLIVSYFNQVAEQNARQAARAAFLNTLEGPEKAIAAMARKVAAVKGITEEAALKLVKDSGIFG